MTGAGRTPARHATRARTRQDAPPAAYSQIVLVRNGGKADVKIIRRVIVFDARDIEAESDFWAGLLGGIVHRDEDWHSIVVDGEWVMGVQRVPTHVAPDWPTGPQQQQVHVDLHVDDLEAADRRAVELGGRQLSGRNRPADNPDGDEMFAVYASPASHPLCFGAH